ncbi:MAG: hypothetical protein LBL84_02155 [Candidatus Nomurabacteria bacterium]|jgi:hypothetical protein|nr:hypothetical protein [Candidatus Nomurabacteria bacterium]
MATDFQNDVLFGRGIGGYLIDDETKARAYSPQMDSIVNLICQLLQETPIREIEGSEIIGFKV